VLLNHLLPDRVQPELHPCRLKGRIPLLDSQASTLAGVKVRLDQVVPPALRLEITEQLKKLTLEIRYQKSLEQGEWYVRSIVLVLCYYRIALASQPAFYENILLFLLMQDKK